MAHGKSNKGDRLDTFCWRRHGAVARGGKPKTLEDVAKNFAVTRERIRQLQNLALVNLRRALSNKENARRFSRISGK